MWLLLLLIAAFAQWNDDSSIRDQTLDILKGCGFTKEEFDHLKSIYEADIPELKQKIARTKALRDEKMEALWKGTKERVKKMEGSSVNEILNKELQKIKEFLNEVSNDDGLPVKGVGKTLQYDLIGQDERRNILINIRKAYPEGAKSAKDFKIMFNVMRAFLVIKGTEHIDDHMKGAPLTDGEQEEQQPPDIEPLIDEKKKKEKEPHTIGKEENKGKSTKMMEDHGMENGGDGYEPPKYEKKGEGEKKKRGGDGKGNVPPTDGKEEKKPRDVPHTEMEKDRGHHLDDQEQGYHEPHGTPERPEDDREDDAEPGSEDYPAPKHSNPEDDVRPEKKGNDARDGKEKVDSAPPPTPPAETTNPKSEETPPVHPPPTPPSFLQSGPPSVQGSHSDGAPTPPAPIVSGPSSPTPPNPTVPGLVTPPTPVVPATSPGTAPVVSGPATPPGPVTPPTPVVPATSPGTAPVVSGPAIPPSPMPPVKPESPTETAPVPPGPPTVQDTHTPTGPQNAAVPPATGPTDAKPPHTRTETKKSTLVASITDVFTTNRCNIPFNNIQFETWA